MKINKPGYLYGARNYHDLCRKMFNDVIILLVLKYAHAEIFPTNV